jgi:hypothetical protein
MSALSGLWAKHSTKPEERHDTGQPAIVYDLIGGNMRVVLAVVCQRISWEQRMPVTTYGYFASSMLRDFAEISVACAITMGEVSLVP